MPIIFTDLPEAATLTGTEIVPITQGANGDRKTTTQDIADLASGSSGGVQSIIAGTNVTVDSSDPLNPIVSSTGGGGSAGSVPVTQVVASSSAGVITIDASSNNYYSVLVDYDLTFVIGTPPAENEATTVTIALSRVSYLVTWPEEWLWPDGVAPYYSYVDAVAYVQLDVIGTAAAPIVNAKLITNYPTPTVRIRKEGEYTVSDGILSLDLSSGDMFHVNIEENITSIIFVNIPGDKFQDGTYTGYGGQLCEIDIMFYQTDPWTFTVEFPDGEWEGGTKYVVPTGENASCAVHMVCYGEEGPGEAYVEVSLASGRAFGYVSSE